MRLLKEQIEGLKKKFSVDRLWSYSRMSTYVEHPWEYRIVYIEKLTRSSNVYTYFGTICHDIIQDFYDKKHSYEEMIDIYDKAILDWRMDGKGYKFMNENVERGYVDNLSEYFKNTEIVPHKIVNEHPICAVFHDDERDKDNVFIGYVDSEYTDDDGVLNIIDYKSSSKSGFSGKKLESASRQLKLYAIGIHQVRNIPYEKIRLRYDLMKYYEVMYLQKNKKWKASKQERSKWVKSQETKIRTTLLDNDYDVFDIDRMVEEAVLINSIDNLPLCVREKFKLRNCYLDIQMTQEEADKLEKFVISTIREIEEKESMNDIDEAFPEEVIDASNEFYYTQLAPQVLEFNKGYREKQALIQAGKSLSLDQEIDVNSLFG